MADTNHSDPRLGGTDAEWELLDRYVAGECSAAEAEQVERLLVGRPDLAEWVAAIRAALDVDTETGDHADWDVDAASARLARTMRGAAGARHRPPPPLRVARTTTDAPRPLGQRVLPWLRAAAIVALVAGGGYLLQWQPSSTPNSAVTPAPRVYATQRGQRAELRLPDGTQVILAPESRLTVPVSFDSARREVGLEGEAYFVATHNTAKPFTVLAGHGVVRDLGTQFDVRAYPDQPSVDVLVTEGKVDLRARHDSTPATLLTQGQLGRLDSTGTTTVRSGVDEARYIGWIDGRLAFEKTPLREVVAELTRWYDLDITLVDSSLGARRVTLMLRDQPVPQVLEALAIVTHARYERLGRRVRFYSLSPSSRNGS